MSEHEEMFKAFCEQNELSCHNQAYKDLWEAGFVTGRKDLEVKLAEVKKSYSETWASREEALNALTQEREKLKVAVEIVKVARSLNIPNLNPLIDEALAKIKGEG